MRFYKSFLTFLSFFCLSLAYGASPYAPSSLGTSADPDSVGAYGYDSAGNRLSNGAKGQTIQVGLVTKPVSIQQGSNSPEQFHYGVGGRRYLRVHEDGRKTFYLNGMDYVIDGDEATSVIRIAAKGYSPDVQVELRSGSSTPEYTYLLKDHLGSPLQTVDDAGNAASPARYGPWGQQVAATGVAVTPYNDAEKAEKIRGYTGHELIASANMGHWNGRGFDYEMGGFLGPDKFIQGRSIAALNRFALGQNNNPNVTDPSGWVNTSSMYAEFKIRRMRERYSIAASHAARQAEYLRSSPYFKQQRESRLVEARRIGSLTRDTSMRQNAEIAASQAVVTLQQQVLASAAIQQAADVGAARMALSARRARVAAADGNVLVDGLPGSAGAWIPRRLSADEMSALTQAHGIEFAQIYTLGRGRNGGGGNYYLYSGTRWSVGFDRANLSGNIIIINHTHPSGRMASSVGDRLSLRRLEEVYGSPQRVSEVVAVGTGTIRFDKYGDLPGR